MHLAIDIGNTRLKFALFDQDRMKQSGVGMEQLTQLLDRSKASISKAILTSVADSGPATALLDKHHISYLTLAHDTLLPIRNAYLTPHTLGPDRIALAVVADHLAQGAPALTIAAGTCLTYNFTEQGSFIGGAISPGITMRFQALHHYTARLPYIDWSAYQDSVYDELTGQDSERSILSGVLRGVLHEVSGTIEQYRRRYSGLQIMVTGGDMGFLVKNLKNDIFARPDMVLEGLNHILLHHA